MRVLFILVIISVIGFPQTINEQIKVLKNASPQKRVELMNHIKKQLITMNQKERLQAIHILKAELQSKTEIHQEFPSQVEEIHHDSQDYQHHIKEIEDHQDQQDHQDHQDHHQNNQINYSKR